MEFFEDCVPAKRKGRFPFGRFFSKRGICPAERAVSDSACFNLRSKYKPNRNLYQFFILDSGFLNFQFFDWLEPPAQFVIDDKEPKDLYRTGALGYISE